MIGKYAKCSVAQHIGSVQVIQMRQRQEGVVLVISLIVLVAMGLAGIAMVRQLGAGLGVAGNLAFKQSASAVGDVGLATAADWLRNVPAPVVLNADSPSQGYFSSWDESFNPLTYDWANSNSVAVNPSNLTTGEKIRYVVHRMCKQPNMAFGDTQCVSFAFTGTAEVLLPTLVSQSFNQRKYRITALPLECKVPETLSVIYK